jgi:hypothetical protein
MKITPVLILQIVGVFQIILCIGSLLIPKLLNFNGELTKVSIIIKQMFWTYAGYILVINFCFGLISLVGANELLDHSFLAKCISFFIFAYWLARIVIQFCYFDTKSAPQGLIYKLGEIGLVALFITLTVVYGWVFYLNL